MYCLKNITHVQGVRLTYILGFLPLIRLPPPTLLLLNNLDLLRTSFPKQGKDNTNAGPGWTLALAATSDNAADNSCCKQI